MTDTCIFCQIAAGKIQAKMILETEEFVVFSDIHQQAPVHALVVPRKHIGSINDIGGDEVELMGKIFAVIQEAADKLGIREAYQLRVNNGKAAGQEVGHLHFHLLGGWKCRINN